MHDLIIIGAGPAGLSAAIAAERAGLSALIVEKGAVVNTILGYPLDTHFFSTADNLEIGGVPFTTTEPHPTRGDALVYYRRCVSYFKLDVRQYEEVIATEALPEGGFRVRTRSMGHGERDYTARAIIFATGSYDTPNPLGVPGELLPKVRHYFQEGHPYFGQHVAVVGGGNSAAEAALALFYAGAHVTVVHFLEDFDPRTKPWVIADLRSWISAGRVGTRFGSRVEAITPTTIVLRSPDGGREELRNDWLFAMIGYRPDVRLLRSLGVAIDEELLVPQHDPATFETNVPGVFIAGVLTAGTQPSKVFIENGRFHGEQIVAALVRRWGRGENV